jgi:hypothetical protein
LGITIKKLKQLYGVHVLSMLLLLITYTGGPVWPSFVYYKKGCTRFAAASDKVYQLLAQGRWFSSGTPASSTTKTGSHFIAEILLNNSYKIITKYLNWYLVRMTLKIENT